MGDDEKALWAVKVVSDIQLDLQLGEPGKSINRVTTEYLVRANSRKEADEKAEALFRRDLLRGLKYSSWAREVEPDAGNDDWRPQP